MDPEAGSVSLYEGLGQSHSAVQGSGVAEVWRLWAKSRRLGGQKSPNGGQGQSPGSRGVGAKPPQAEV